MKKLIAAPEIPPRDPVKLAGTSPFTGATVVNLSPAVEEELSIEGARAGVVIADIAENSPAAAVGLRKGDIVRAVNDVKENNIDERHTACDRGAALLLEAPKSAAAMAR